MTIILKEARFKDCWKKVYKRKYRANLNKISFIDGSLYDSLELNLDKGINVIIGKNGIGKSNFIRSLYNVFCGDNSNRIKFRKLNDDNNILIEYTFDDDKRSVLYEVNDQDLDSDIYSYLFDPCTLIPEIQKIFYEQYNVEELLQGYSAFIYEDDRLKALNYLANNNYTKVEVYNLEEVYEAFPILPFFIVKRDDVTYDSTKMGLGELSILYFDWLLNYLKLSSDQKILLIEEPESFLPPIVQIRLTNILATLVAEDAFQCLISTHSEHILKKIPKTHIKLMLYDPILSKYKFINIKDDTQILNNLGLQPIKKAVLFFEDQAAKIFLSELICKSDSFHLDNFYFHNSGSESEIITQIKPLPNSYESLKFIAIFDGDGRGRVESQIGDSKFAFLPSNLSPEEHIIKHIGQSKLNELAKFLDVTDEVLVQALQSAEGLDHHDYFYKISELLKTDFQSLFKKLCQFWIKQDTSKTEIKNFYNAIDSIIG